MFGFGKKPTFTSEDLLKATIDPGEVRTGNPVKVITSAPIQTRIMMLATYLGKYQREWPDIRDTAIAEHPHLDNPGADPDVVRSFSTIFETNGLHKHGITDLLDLIELLRSIDQEINNEQMESAFSNLLVLSLGLSSLAQNMSAVCWALDEQHRNVWGYVTDVYTSEIDGWTDELVSANGHIGNKISHALNACESYCSGLNTLQNIAETLLSMAQYHRQAR